MRDPSRLALVSAWLLAVSAFGSTACSGKVRGARADAAPARGEHVPDDAGVALPHDAEAGALLGAQTDAGPDAEAGVAPLVDASDEPVPATVARMNDVSILFPLPASADELGLLLAPSASGSRGVLFPSDLYASEPIPFARGGPTPTTYVPYGDLRVVAMRIDPCFASLAPDPHGVGCTAQLRLVFQRVTELNDAAFADDSAMHLFYDLARDEFLALARALVALRIANDQGDELGPLAPHPIMVRQGLGGVMSQGVQSLILQYAGEQNLVRMAQADLVVDPDLGGWDMSVFDLGNTPDAAIPRAIPSIADVDGGSIFVEGVLAPLFPSPSSTFGYSVRFSSITTSADNISPLGNGDAGGLAVPDRQAALDALARVENPRDNSADTIDCLGCHMAAPYLGARPQISQRVVNETAAVVEYLNALTP
jgi:hypothetical protein